MAIKKVIVDFDDEEKAFIIDGNISYWLTDDQISKIEIVESEIVESEQPTKTTIEQLVQLKSSGYTASEIVELKQNGLI